MKDFRDLKVWEKAHALALVCYKGTTAFPKQEMFGLTSQIRRSDSSIPANIAEGCGRRRECRTSSIPTNSDGFRGRTRIPFVAFT